MATAVGVTAAEKAAPQIVNYRFFTNKRETLPG